MSNVYTVQLEVNSPKYGRGHLVAKLNEDQMTQYLSMNDDQRFVYLQRIGAKFVTDDYTYNKDASNEVQQASTKETTTSTPNKPQVSRKMRVNINGHDTGWVDVTEENEDQYNEMMNKFQDLQNEFVQRRKELAERFTNIFPFETSLFDIDPFLISPKDEDDKKADDSE